MKSITYFGVPMVIVEEDEAIDGRWRADPGPAEVVRVERPRRESWPLLRRSGFLPKPQQISWVADVGEDEESFTAALSSRERQKIRSARRRLAAERLILSVRGLDQALFDSFLPLYEASLARMRHGVSVAASERDEILGDRDRYFAVCATDGPDLVGCALARREADLDTVRVRFSAVDLPHREASLSRVLYLEAARVTRDFGHRTFSLGKDRNLYGHISQPGLLRFKRQLGFTPRPSHHIDAATGYDQADLVLRTRALADPTMLLSYAGDVPDDRLRLEVFSAANHTDLRPYSAKFPNGMRVHQLAAGAVAASSW
jgi:hypothetical protein